MGTRGATLKKGLLYFFVLTVDAGGGVVLDAQVDVLVDAEAKVARVGEVAADELVLLHLQARLLQGGGAAGRAGR